MVDNLPSLLFGKTCPGRHTVIQIALGDVPEKLAIAGALRFPCGQSRNVSSAFSVWSMTRGAVVQIVGLRGGRVLALEGILLLFGGGRRAMESRILRWQCNNQKKR